jgi:hypothetical protein
MHTSMPEEMASVPLFTRKGNTSLHPTMIKLSITKQPCKLVDEPHRNEVEDQPT